MTNTLVSRLRDEYVQQSARCGEEDSQERSLLAQEAADEIERLQKREAQFAAALYAVKEVVAKDSPQWLLADQLARMMLSQPADEPSESLIAHPPQQFRKGECPQCHAKWMLKGSVPFTVKYVYCGCGFKMEYETEGWVSERTNDAR